MSATVVICILISCGFDTIEVWSKWLEKGIPVVMHYSNCSQAQVKEINRFCKRHKAVVVPSLRTSWCDISVLNAEIAMYDATTVSFPNATHYVLVSEKTIPLVSATELIEYIQTHLRMKSQFGRYTAKQSKNEQLFVNQLDYLKTLPMKIQVCGQFKILHVAHFKRIRHTLKNMMPFLSKGDWYQWALNDACLPPEEFVILSTLCNVYNVSNDFYVNKVVVVDDFRPRGALRSHVFNDTRELKQYLKENKELSFINTRLFMRKFDKRTLPHVIELLERYNVFGSPTNKQS